MAEAYRRTTEWEHDSRATCGVFRLGNERVPYSAG